MQHLAAHGDDTVRALADAEVFSRLQVGGQIVFMNHRLLHLLRRPEDATARDESGPGGLF